MTCPVPECNQLATQGWQRYATPDELETARTDPNNPSVQPHETSALVQVIACDDHTLDADLAAQVHDADCDAPPYCLCSASAT